MDKEQKIKKPSKLRALVTGWFVSGVVWSIIGLLNTSPKGTTTYEVVEFAQLVLAIVIWVGVYKNIMKKKNYDEQNKKAIN